MLNLLPSNLDLEDTNDEKKASLIWKGRLIVLLLYNEQKLSFENINAESFTETVDKLLHLKNFSFNFLFIKFCLVFHRLTN